MMGRIFISIFFCFLFQFHTICQDTAGIKKIKVLPVPAIGYSPETKTYVGAVTLFSFNFFNDPGTRLSNAKVELNYTWNKQLIAEVGWNLFTRSENWFSKGQIQYAKYPEFYYGVGIETPDDNKVTYSSNRFAFELSALRKIRNTLFTGLNIKHSHYWNVSQTSDAAIHYGELSDGIVNGVGLTILKDSRNNLLTPAEGIFAYANTTANFSGQNYLEIMLDLRYYKTWGNKYTVAARLMNEFNFGTPPFFDYAMMGGDKLVRGYYYGRYRDRNLGSLQMEFRFPLFWRLGMAAFGGVSNVYPGLDDLSIHLNKYNGGIGLRFLVDKKDRTNLRLDYGIGNDNNSGFYIAFGESF